MNVVLYVIVIVVVILIVTSVLRTRRYRPRTTIFNMDEILSTSAPFTTRMLLLFSERLKDRRLITVRDKALISVLLLNGMSHEATRESLRKLITFIDAKPTASRTRLQEMFKPYTDAGVSIHDDPWFHLAFTGPVTSQTRESFPGRPDIRDYVLQTSHSFPNIIPVVTKNEDMWKALTSNKGDVSWIFSHIHSAMKIEEDDNDQPIIRIVFRFAQTRAHTYEWALVQPETVTHAPIYVKLFRNYTAIELVLTVQLKAVGDQISLVADHAVCRLVLPHYVDSLASDEVTAEKTIINKTDAEQTQTTCSQIGCRRGMCYFKCVGSQKTRQLCEDYPECQRRKVSCSMEGCIADSNDNNSNRPPRRYREIITPRSQITVGCESNDRAETIKWHDFTGDWGSQLKPEQAFAGKWTADDDDVWKKSSCAIVDVSAWSINHQLGPEVGNSNARLWTAFHHRAQPRFRFCSTSRPDACGGDLTSTARFNHINASESFGRLFDGDADDLPARSSVLFSDAERSRTYAYVLGDLSRPIWIGATCEMDCKNRDRFEQENHNQIIRGDMPDESKYPPCEQVCKRDDPNVEPHLKYTEHFVDPTFATDYCYRIATDEAGEEDKGKLIISCANVIHGCEAEGCTTKSRRAPGRLVYELRPGDKTKRRSDALAHDNFMHRAGPNSCIYGPWRNDASGCSKTCREGGDGIMPQIRSVLYSDTVQSACKEISRVVPCNTTAQCCSLNPNHSTACVTTQCNYTWSETTVELGNNRCSKARRAIAGPSTERGCKYPADQLIGQVFSCDGSAPPKNDKHDDVPAACWHPWEYKRFEKETEISDKWQEHTSNRRYQTHRCKKIRQSSLRDGCPTPLKTEIVDIAPAFRNSDCAHVEACRKCNRTDHSGCQQCPKPGP